MRVVAWLTTLLAVTFNLGGCGGGKKEVTGDASGKVTLEGTPVTSGSISFISKDGKSGSATIDGTGSYNAKNVVVGKYKVVISPPPLADPGAPGTTKQKGMAEFPGHPKKYRSDLTTDLEAEIKEGMNPLDFDMKPQPDDNKKKKK